MGTSKPSSLLLRVSERLIVPATFAFAAGTGASLFLRHYFFGGLIAGGGLLVLAAAVAWRHNRMLISLALVQSAIFTGGMSTGLANRDAHDSTHLESLIASHAFPLNEPLLIVGRICEEGPERGNDIEVVLELMRYRQKDGWADCSGKAILRVAAPDPDDHGVLLAALRQGVDLRTWAVWREPLNFENPGSFDRVGFLHRRGIYLTGRTKSPRLIESVSGAFPGILPAASRMVRARIKQAIYPLRVGPEPQSGAILQSLLTGDRSNLERKTEETFQNAGSFHILVVSGLHVAWVAGAWLFLLRVIAVPDRFRFLSSAVVILFYAAVVEFQPAITRCLWMFLLYLAGRILIRRTDPVNILFSAAFLLLAADPDRLYEAGYQLSFLSVAAIVLTAIPIINTRLKPLLQPMRHAGFSDRLFLERGKTHRWGRRLRTYCELFAEQTGDSVPRIKQGSVCFTIRVLSAVIFAAASLCVLSVSVQIWIAPLLAYYFNRISWIAPLSNIVAVPVGSVSLASGIFTAILGEIPFLGSVLVRFAGISSSFLLHSAEWITRIPYTWQRCPTPPAGLVAGGVLLLMIVGLSKSRKTWIPPACSVLLIGIIGLGASRSAAGIRRGAGSLFSSGKENGWLTTSSPLSLTMLDVGEGDSIVIRFPNGKVWILDAGGVRSGDFGEDSGEGLDIGEAVVSRYLWRGWGIMPDRVWLSHTDMDHAGGAVALLHNFGVRRLQFPQSQPDKLLHRIMETAKDRQTSIDPVAAGTVEKVADVLVRVLHPPAFPSQPSTNDRSAVLHVTFKRFSAILTGDLERKGEGVLLRNSGNIASGLLKVAHHGSASGTSPDFLDAVGPRWAVISAGRNNAFGHPSPAVLSRLSSRGVRVYLTTDQGAVTFLTDGMRYEIRSHIHGVLERGELD